MAKSRVRQDVENRLLRILEREERTKQLQNRVGILEVNAGRLLHDNQSIPVIDAIATVDETGKRWAIALVNRHPSEDVACTVNTDKLSLDGTYNATVLTGDSPDSYNDIENPDRVAPKKMQLIFKEGVADLPPHSLTIVQFSLPK